MTRYDKLKKRKLAGWNTWNVRSMLSHVLMPHGFAINIGIKEYKEGDFLGETLLGRLSDRKYAQRMYGGVEEVLPGAHSYNGDYTEITVKWKDIEIFVQTATLEDNIYIKIIPITNQKTPATIVAELGIMWNRQGSICSKDDYISVKNSTVKTDLRMIGSISSDKNIPNNSPYLAAKLIGGVYFYTGLLKSPNEINAIIENNKNKYDLEIQKHGDLVDYYQSIQDTLAWNIIYDPTKDRILTPVSRTWSVEWGGYVQHCWDMYFNALLYSNSDKELAYISAIEITKEITKEGFVPNCVAANGFITLDRSQPPVGSLVVSKIYEKFNDKWFLEMVFDELFSWNEWYFINRQVDVGLLGWGSSKYETKLDNHWETAGVGKFYGAAMESGLDNSPMYDDISMNEEKNTMNLGDVGLTSLYIADTIALIDIARILLKENLIELLEERLESVKIGLEKLWCEEKSIYLNYKTDTKEFDYRISPTNFYPLLTGLISKKRANKMVKKHLLNENEFWGEWVIPSISKDNPAFEEQDYWRGRIWAPMNLLVYFGLKKMNMDSCAQMLAQKSGNLIMKEWKENRHVHENYCALTGVGCNKENSEKHYSWGALLSYIYISEFKNDK